MVDLGDVPADLASVLDEHLLGGLPRRFAALRYRELCGRNWLSLSDSPTPSKQPSALIKEAIGIPAHDLRTAIADLMRRADPTEAARMIAGVLGHRDARTAEAYRALCAGDAAAREWAAMREQIGGGEQSAAKPRWGSSTPPTSALPMALAGGSSPRMISTRAAA